VRIQSESGERLGQGVCVPLEDGTILVLTCYHVVEKAGDVSAIPLTIFNERHEEVRDLAATYRPERSDPDQDLAVLSVVDNRVAMRAPVFVALPDTFPLPAGIVGVMRPSDGTSHIFNADVAHSTPLAFSIGRKVVKLPRVWRLIGSTDVRDGISGSPVVLQGAVIGLAHVARDASPNRASEGYVVPIESWLAKNPDLLAQFTIDALALAGKERLTTAATVEVTNTTASGSFFLTKKPTIIIRDRAARRRTHDSCEARLVLPESLRPNVDESERFAQRSGATSSESLVERLSRVEKRQDLIEALGGLDRTFETTNILIENLKLLPNPEKILQLAIDLLRLDWGVNLSTVNLITPVLTRMADITSSNAAVSELARRLESDIYELDARMQQSVESTAFWLKRCKREGAYARNLIQIATVRGAMEEDNRARQVYYGGSRNHLLAVRRHLTERSIDYHLHELSSVMLMHNVWHRDPSTSGPAATIRESIIAALPTAKLPTNARDNILRELEY
jgi:hypothetical protein